MGVLSVMIIGKRNDPLFFYTPMGSSRPSSEILLQQMAIHSALDTVEERRRKSAFAAPGTVDLYFGQLLQVDEYKVFGHYSNTHTKTMVICDSGTDSSDPSVRELVMALRGIYTTATQNPFQMPETPVVSMRFRNAISQALAAYNSLRGLHHEKSIFSL